MKRVILISLLCFIPSNALGFEQAMHAYIAHEAMKNLRISSQTYVSSHADQVEAMKTLQRLLGSRCKGADRTLCAAVSSWISRAKPSKVPVVSRKLDLVFPGVGKKPPFRRASDGITVPVPEALRKALSSLGWRDFKRHFFAGVFGADNFPDVFTGGFTAHRDWSHVRKWASWEWGQHMWSQAKKMALFTALAKEQPWDARRRRRIYWGKSYTDRELADRLQAEAVAFTYGYLIHFAQDAIAHEMVSSFNGGAYEHFRLVAPNHLVELRHSAVESYLLEKVRPWLWKDGKTLSDLSIPVPFLRVALMEGKGVTQAPLSLHLLAFDKLEKITRQLFRCRAEPFPAAQCAGKSPPAVFHFLKCAESFRSGEKVGLECLETIACHIGKRALRNQPQRVREAKEGWLLLALAMARRDAELALHPKIHGRFDTPLRKTTLQTFRGYLRDYGFRDAYNAGHAKETGSDPVMEAVRVYVEQFVLPAILPVRLRYDRAGKLTTPQVDPAVLEQLRFDCKYMAFTNLVAICDFAVDTIEKLVSTVLATAQRAIKDISALFEGSLSAARPKPKRVGRKDRCTVDFFSLRPDPKMNAVYPCRGTDSCAGGRVCSATPTEKDESRELKRRLQRFVGVDKLKSGKLKTEWNRCKLAGKSDQARADCFSNEVFMALLKGQLGAADAPIHSSPWMRRALILTQLAMISEGSVGKLVDGVSKGFGSKATCHRKATARPHLYLGVMASLVGKNDRRGNKFANGYYDELEWGKFALYDPSCAPLSRTILPPIPDSDGDGINDVYDTCPEVACQSGWRVDPTGNHIGDRCVARGGNKAQAIRCVSTAPSGGASTPSRPRGTSSTSSSGKRTTSRRLVPTRKKATRRTAARRRATTRTTRRTRRKRRTSRVRTTGSTSPRTR